MTDRLSDPDSAMRAYYARRASEYDSWWLGTGLFAERSRPGWDEERDTLRATLAALPPARTLDRACGTGYLTSVLPGAVVGLDQSPEMLAIASARMPAAEFVSGEGTSLPFADDTFERVFTSRFYGHLQPDECDASLAEAARVAPELVIVDSALRPGVDAEQWQERVLEDGSRSLVYKRYFRVSELEGEVLFDGDWFVAVSRRWR